ncbi:MAG: Flp family type IVb pilin [Pseudomonadota bacterium]
MKFSASQSGAVAIEYGMIATFVVIGLLAGLQAFAGNSTNGFMGAMGKISNAVTGR